MTKPVFIFSLPRSGSTLAQKVLAAHEDVSTTAEPWFLLPFLYAQRSEGVYAEYAQCTAAKAIDEFVEVLPNGQDDYRAAIREAALRLYAAAAQGARCFVDKTPRYHLIIEDLLDVFPEAKCILLWRNPLAIAASIVDTWGKNGRWIAYRYKVDLYKGLENLVNAAESHPNRFLQVRYEDMVSKPGEIWQKIFAYLDLEYDSTVLDRYRTVDFSGSMGDQTGEKKYKAIAQESVDAWPQTFNSPLRRIWARRYLDWIGSERLQMMGYDKAKLELMLTGSLDIRPSRLLSDMLFMALGAAHASLDLSGIKRQVRRTLLRQRCYAAT